MTAHALKLVTQPTVSFSTPTVENIEIDEHVTMISIPSAGMAAMMIEEFSSLLLNESAPATNNSFSVAMLAMESCLMQSRLKPVKKNSLIATLPTRALHFRAQ